MTRAIPVTVAVVAVAAGVATWQLSGGCGTPRTRIAQRTLYDGPATLPAGAEGWPKWLGPRGDGISRETGLADAWPAGGPPQLWSAEVGLGYSSPVAADGRVYLFSMNDGAETLTCFDANSGRILWSQAGGQGRSASYPGTRATPTIDGDDIFTLGGGGELTCRDAQTGAARWGVNVLELTGAGNLGWGTASSPLVDGGSVYVQGGKGGPVALKLDRTNGSVAWRSQATGTAGYAQPLLVDVEGTPQLVVFGGNALYGMNPADGRTVWSHPWATSYDVNASTPVYRDGHLFATSEYGKGAAMLRLRPGGAIPLWENREVQGKYQPAILDGDALYVNSAGTLTCLSWPDGAVRWREPGRALRLGAGGSFVRFGDKLIALGERGKLSLARATPAGMELIGQAEVFDDSQVWSMPTIYGGRLYAKGGQELICFDLSTGGTPRP